MAMLTSKLTAPYEFERPLHSRREELYRRAFDLVIATVALILVLPALIAIAVAIRVDSPGPILFRQTRGGINGRPFRMYKFRTMTVTEENGEITQAIRGDPRVTRVGRHLRQTSLDELPQLINVIRGEMSLVGPRPHALQHDIEFSKLVDGYALRSRVKPGITGWAQIHGLRGGVSTIEAIQRRVDLDNEYVAHRNLRLDILILIRTGREVFRQTNAY
ncbi:exopolysaccharide biosynthesis polyprenyl glycosylphosphotransferase [Microvirga makkahensis]|uniref:Exopolysaccharide biosynthesis polyprenyl glycosylphosphotransferase n=1 Tax=Microvirga makkahensis TaxID=1128670 RepID=A0A7X3MUP2_9HYPH|nr:exopolysaccharide biosynthesis polyprenyl glycosylphosphotransferase [Microvirga makkahensis]MXQ13571.1 exopolysaccharide biosynthesis polyprenyl glycosylphosphotransferase [Microvirga makkahensis]